MNCKIIIALIVILMAVQVVAGIGISPPRIMAEHMSRGSHFEKEVHLSGLMPGSLVRIEKEGSISEWISLDRGSEFIFPKGSASIPIKISIDVPDDTANGQYIATVKLSSVPVEESGSSNTVSVLPGVRLTITVDVTGEQIKDYKVDSISIGKSEAGSPIPIILDIENNGNVLARPTMLQFHVLDRFRAEQLFSANITSMNYVQSHTRESNTVLVENELPAGQYWALIEVYDGAEIIFSDERPFEIMESGHLRKKGLFRILETPLPAITGDTIKLVGWFENTGDLPVDAKMTGEIYQGRHLITVTESEQINIAPSGIMPLTAYYKPQKSGKYTIHSYVIYDGKQSSSKKATLVVRDEKDGMPWKTRAVIILIAMTVVIAGILLIARIKRPK